MCNNQAAFVQMEKFASSEKVTLGDGRSLDDVGQGTVNAMMILPDGSTRECALQKVLYVPELAFNLVSVSKATEASKIVQFDITGCSFLNDKEKVTAFAESHNNLFHVRMETSHVSANTVSTEPKAKLWHRRLGHLNSQSMRQMVREDMVNNLDCDAACEINFCEACVGGKQCKRIWSTILTVMQPARSIFVKLVSEESSARRVFN